MHFLGFVGTHSNPIQLTYYPHNNYLKVVWLSSLQQSGFVYVNRSQTKAIICEVFAYKLEGNKIFFSGRWSLARPEPITWVEFFVIKLLCKSMSRRLIILNKYINIIAMKQG